MHSFNVRIEVLSEQHMRNFMGMYAHALHLTPQSSTVVSIGNYWPPLSLHLNRLAINALFLVKAWPKFWSGASWFSTKSGWNGLLPNDSTTIWEWKSTIEPQHLLDFYCNEACLMIQGFLISKHTHTLVEALDNSGRKACSLHWRSGGLGVMDV